jgi:hypothetical protein
VADATCSIESCNKPPRRKKASWCDAHYQRWRKYGDPLGLAPRQPSGDRFWANVNKHGLAPEHRPDLGPCWPWQGSRFAAGYGQFKLAGRNRRAQQVAHELLVGPIPEGLELDHLCRVRHCVKVVADEHGPAHLELVTAAENVRRGLPFSASFAGVNARKTHCKRGHPFDEANTYHIKPSASLPNGGRGCRTCRGMRLLPTDAHAL